MRRGRAVSTRGLVLAGWLALAACNAPVHEARVPRPHVAQNAKAAATSRLPRLLERGPATGQGVLIGEWDEGAVRASHADVIGRVRRRDQAELSEHATHIAGTMTGAGSLDAAARGMAIDARLWSFRWDWDVLEERAAAPFIAVSAHAYGVALGWAPAGEGCEGGATFFGGVDHEDHAFGAYGARAAELDRMLFETGAVSVWAAGNERMDAGPSGDAPHYHWPDCSTERDDAHADEARLQYGTLGGPISAKNAIAVGAIADIEGDVAPELIVPLSFSSFGPTDDGRIKPDLAASGETLYSASAAADDAYGVFGGTSSSAAVVAGGVALLTERYRATTDGRDPSPAAIKALLVHTAREAGERDGPDYALGYGLFDVDAAASVIDAVDAQARDGELHDGETIELRTESIEAGSALRATLAWLDPPGPFDDPDRAALVNDLDVQLIAPDGETVFYPWRLDRDDPAAPASREAPNDVDNVERVDVAAGDNTWTGRWTLRLSASRPLQGGAAQAFSVIASVPLAAVERAVLGSTRRVLIELAPGESTAETSIAIDNLGGGELAWSLASDARWLELTEASGTAPSRPALRIDVSDLPEVPLQLATLTLRAEGQPATAIGVVVQRACEGACAEVIDSCASATLGSALGAAVAHGHSDEAFDVQPASCGHANGASAVLTWRAPHAGTFEVSLHDAAPEAVLYALDGACAGAELACATAGAHSLALELSVGQPVALVIDSPPDRAFDLSILEPRAADPDACEPDGAPCDDGNACTQDDTCIGGACAGIPFECEQEPEPAPPDATAADDAGSVPIEGRDAAVSIDGGESPASAPAACGCRVARSPSTSLAASLAPLIALLLAHRIRRRSIRSP